MKIYIYTSHCFTRNSFMRSICSILQQGHLQLKLTNFTYLNLEQFRDKTTRLKLFAKVLPCSCKVFHNFISDLSCRRLIKQVIAQILQNTGERTLAVDRDDFTYSSIEQFLDKTLTQGFLFKFLSHSQFILSRQIARAL